MTKNEMAELIATAHEREGFIEFHSEKTVLNVPAKALQEYAKIAMDIYEKLKNMAKAGKIAQKDFETSTTEPPEIQMIKKFQRGGVLDVPEIHGWIKKIGEIYGMDPKIWIWQLLREPVICDVIHSTAEGIVDRMPDWNQKAGEAGSPMESEEDWDLYFTDYLFRGILSATKGEIFEE